MKNEKTLNPWRERLIRYGLALLIPVAALVLWQVLSDQGRINQSVFTSPRKIGETFTGMVREGTYLHHVTISLSRIVKGFLIGSAAGLTLGTLAVLFKRVGQALSLLISLLRPIPPIAFIPFLILWMGIGETSKVAVIVIGAFWPVLLNTMQGIRDADEKLLELGRAFGKSRSTVFLKIVLPSAFPSIFTGLRLGIGNAWTCVVTAEMIAASAGVGFLISYGRELSQPHVLFVGIATIGVVGLIIDFLVIRLQKKVVYWTENER